MMINSQANCLDSLSARRVDWHIRHSVWYLLIGMVLIALCVTLNAPTGILTGVMLTMLGSGLGTIEKWRTEPGLWMLAAVWLAFAGPFWLLLECMPIVDAVRGKTDGIPVAIDVFISTSILWLQARLYWSVIVLYRRVGQHPRPTN
jgi:hypothetical protein